MRKRDRGRTWLRNPKRVERIRERDLGKELEREKECLELRKRNKRDKRGGKRWLKRPRTKTKTSKTPKKGRNMATKIKRKHKID